MPQNSDNQITLFIRDEKAGRHAFNPKALKALGVDPTEARERGSGADKSNDPKNHPWTMGWLPSYRIESRIYARYILKNLPDARPLRFSARERHLKSEPSAIVFQRGYQQGALFPPNQGPQGAANSFDR
jgi:hypothetical protein